MNPSRLVPLLLAVPLLVAGCIQPAAQSDENPRAQPVLPHAADAEPSAQSSQTEADGASNATTEPERAPEAEPAPEPAHAPEPANATPPAQTPAPRAPYTARFEGWAAPPGDPQAGPPTTVHAFPVEGGARNATVRVEAVATYGDLGRLPREPGNLTVEVVNPSGFVIAQGGRDVTSEQPDVTFQIATLDLPGEYHVRVRLLGVSDGATAGDRYVATIHVAYA